MAIALWTYLREGETYAANPPEELSSLLLISARQSHLYKMPMVSVEFCLQPHWSPAATPENLMTFYTNPAMPPGTGLLDYEGARGGPSKVFTLLSYHPSEAFQISRATVEILDKYLGNLNLATGEIVF